MNKKTTQPDIFGQAISDFFYGKDTEHISVYSDDFDNDHIPLDYLFRDFGEMPLIEQTALQHCSGKTLDVGCGAGSHSLYLQNSRNLEVTGIDISPKGIDICQKRGLKKVICLDFYTLKDEKFDTLLLLMNGAGIIGKLKNMTHFFTQIDTLLAPGGQVLLDSSDLHYLFEQDEDGGIWVDASDGYYGELCYRIGYRHEVSDQFDWLFVDFQTLQFAAESNGFSCELLKEGTHYDYLVRLARA